MNNLKLFLYLLLIQLNVYAVEINEDSTKVDILSHAYIYVDETNSLTRDEVETKTFIRNTQEVLGYGFVPNTVLWIRFTLKNSSKLPIKKILEYDNPEAEEVYFYYDDKIIKDGMFHIDTDRLSLHPTLDIVLAPGEEKTYTIRVHSSITSLIVKLVLWDREEFIRSDAKHKTYLLIFFSSIFILFIYNFMLLIFTKDRAYFYYILYLTGMMLFQAMNYGVAQYYLFSNELSIFLTKASMGVTSFMSIGILLFTREFLNTKKFKKIDLIFKLYIYILPFISLLSYDNFFFNLNIIIILFPLAIIVIAVAFYVYQYGEKQAKFYIIGWSVVHVSLVFLTLKYVGVYDVTHNLAYIIEIAFTLEAILFSIALAHRINLLSEQKSAADNKLIVYQRQEKLKLEKLIREKTNDLQCALEEKNILFKELNHRLKNNIQMILSLVKLQIARAKTKETKTQLTATKNRISAFSYLYEILHLQENKMPINTREYFQSIVETIDMNFDKDVKTELDISYNLDLNEIMYCGLIVNELVTNSYKYAFETTGHIKISLEKKKQLVCLSVEDDGIGYTNSGEMSLGLEIVETLAKKQLQGFLGIDGSSGTTVTIIWKKDG